MDANERALRDTFRHMDGDRANQIKQTYYEAVCGLRALADALEQADLEMPGPVNDHLIGEHLMACEALEAMHKSQLGRIL